MNLVNEWFFCLITNLAIKKPKTWPTVSDKLDALNLFRKTKKWDFLVSGQRAILALNLMQTYSKPTPFALFHDKNLVQCPIYNDNSSASQTLQKLRILGMVDIKVNGKFISYSLHQKTINELLNLLELPWDTDKVDKKIVWTAKNTTDQGSMLDFDKIAESLSKVYKFRRILWDVEDKKTYILRSKILDYLHENDNTCVTDIMIALHDYEQDEISTQLAELRWMNLAKWERVEEWVWKEIYYSLLPKAKEIIKIYLSVKEYMKKVKSVRRIPKKSRIKI